MKAQLEKTKDEIIALRPVYTEKGNATIVYLRKGEILDSRGMRAVMNALARIYAIDLAAQRSLVEQRLQRQATAPFYLGATRVFVPLKMRRPLAPKDAVYGYVDVNCMGKALAAKDDDRNSRLQLSDGREIEILSPRHTVEQGRGMGRNLLEALAGEGQLDAGEAMMIGAAKQLHSMFKVLERRLIHIEEMIAEGEHKYE